MFKLSVIRHKPIKYAISPVAFRIIARTPVKVVSTTRAFITVPIGTIKIV